MFLPPIPRYYTVVRAMSFRRQRYVTGGTPPRLFRMPVVAVVTDQIGRCVVEVLPHVQDIWQESALPRRQVGMRDGGPEEEIFSPPCPSTTVFPADAFCEFLPAPVTGNVRCHHTIQLSSVTPTANGVTTSPKTPAMAHEPPMATPMSPSVNRDGEERRRGAGDTSRDRVARLEALEVAEWYGHLNSHDSFPQAGRRRGRVERFVTATPEPAPMVPPCHGAPFLALL